MGEAVLRRGLLLVVGVAAAVLMVGAAAYACTAFATLEFVSSADAPGAVVEGTGKGFRSSHGQSPGGEVRVRWDRRDGAVLWAGEASEDGTVAFDFTVPDVAPGHHVIVATQSTTDPETGEETETPVYGTPGRQSFEVVAAASQGQLAPAASSEPSSAAAEVSPQSAAPADAAGGSTGVSAPAGEPSQPASSPATGAAAPAAAQPAAADAGGVPSQPAPAAADQAPAAAAAVPAAVATPERQAVSGQGSPAASAPTTRERFAAAERSEAAATSSVEWAQGTAAGVAGGTQQRTAPTGWERFAAAERAAAGATAAFRAPVGVVDVDRTAVPAVGSTGVSALDSGAVAVSILVLVASLGLAGLAGRRLSGLRSALAQ